MEDIFQLSPKKKEAVLKNMVWEKNKFFKKRFSTAFVDENGVLQNFDSPKQVKKAILEPANI